MGHLGNLPTEPLASNVLNNHIHQYLEYYCNEATDTDYAVLVNGEWGAGKTHVVKDFLKGWQGRQTDRRVLYVSLYGVNSFRQIESAFFEQLYPIAGSKAAKIAGKVAKGLLRAALKIDLDESSTATINAQVPDIDFKDHFSTPQGSILVFDDLERCAIKLPDILGYINQFVEHDQFKAIIVADESKINESAYPSIKEKLVGQTLRVCSDAQSVIPIFISSVKDKKTRSLLSNDIDHISQIFSSSKTNNLRLLKRSIWLIERVSSTFSDEHWKSPIGITEFVRLLLGVSLDCGFGRITEDSIDSFGDDYFLAYLKAKDGNTSAAQSTRERYPTISFDQFPFDVDFLRDVLFNGIVEESQVHLALKNSVFYADPKEDAAWRIAWHSYEISDDQFEDAVAKVEREFKGDPKWEAGEIIHVLGLRLRFSRIEAIQLSIADVVREGREFIDKLANAGTLPLLDDETTGLIGGWGGLGFSERETPEFRELVQYYYSNQNILKEAKRPGEANQLLSFMKTDQKLFYRMVCLNNVQTSLYYDIPILKNIDPTEFVETFVSLNGLGQVDVSSALKDRYSHGRLEGELSDERQWLSSVVDELKARVDKMRPGSRDRVAGLLRRDLEPVLLTSNAVCNAT